MTETTLFKNANLVLVDRVIKGHLVVKGGEIAEIGEGDTALPGVDCDGDYLSPGLIELHTDNLERHMSPRPKVNWPHKPAIIAHDAELAGCGITTVFDAIRTGSIVTSKKSRYGRYARGMANEILEARAAGNLRISHFLHVRAEICSETLVEELDEFGADDRVGILSLMDHTPGQRQFTDIAKLKVYTCGKYGLNEEEWHEHLAHLYHLRELNGDRHAKAAVAAAGRLGAVLASHDDSTADQVAQSAKVGTKIAEFPTKVAAAQACRQHGIPVMMGAPNYIRGASHSGNASAQEVAELGLLDIFSSDYVPAALLNAAVRLGQDRGDMAAGLRTVTHRPAQAVGLTDRGQIAPGCRADLIRIKDLGQAAMVRGTWVCGARVG